MIEVRAGHSSNPAMYPRFPYVKILDSAGHSMKAFHSISFTFPSNCMLFSLVKLPNASESMNPTSFWNHSSVTRGSPDPNANGSIFSTVPPNPNSVISVQSMNENLPMVPTGPAKYTSLSISQASKVLSVSVISFSLSNRTYSRSELDTLNSSGIDETVSWVTPP